MCQSLSKSPLTLALETDCEAANTFQSYKSVLMREYIEVKGHAGERVDEDWRGLTRIGAPAREDEPQSHLQQHSVSLVPHLDCPLGVRIYTSCAEQQRPSVKF